MFPYDFLPVTITAPTILINVALSSSDSGAFQVHLLIACVCMAIHLCTDTDVIVLDSRSNAGLHTCFPYQARVSSLGFGISLDGCWVMKGDKKILWLPFEYRSEASAVFGNTIAIGCKTGRVIIIQLSTECKGL